MKVKEHKESESGAWRVAVRVSLCAGRPGCGRTSPEGFQGGRSKGTKRAHGSPGSRALGGSATQVGRVAARRVATGLA